MFWALTGLGMSIKKLKMMFLSGYFSYLCLDVAKLFNDDIVFQFEYIDAVDMALLSGRIDPLITPAHDAAKPQAKNLFDLDVSLRRLAKEILPELGDNFLPGVHRAVGSRSRVFEDAIVAHKLHHSGHIMPVEGFIEFENGAHGCLYLGHFHRDNASLPAGNVILSPADEVVDEDGFAVVVVNTAVIMPKHLVWPDQCFGDFSTVQLLRLQPGSFRPVGLKHRVLQAFP